MAKFELDTEFVRKLAQLLHETHLGEIELADGDKRVRVVWHYRALGGVGYKTGLALRAPFRSQRLPPCRSQPPLRSRRPQPTIQRNILAP